MATTDGQSAPLPRLLLASRSPRRRALLQQAGLAFRPHDAVIDDGGLVPRGGDPRHWAMSLAYLKASSAVPTVPEEPAAGAERAVILAADTVCVVGDRIVGQPADAEEARSVLRSMVSATHGVVTGVALLDPLTMKRDLFCDEAEVTLGPLDEAEIQRYLATGDWRGKAGGYNLEDRLAAGWPIQITGDRTAVVGLPIDKLRRHLRAFAASRVAVR